MENTNFLIIGDLNGDLSRNKYYNDVKLREFLKITKCMSVNNNNKSINFTFQKSENKSRIDHVIIDRDKKVSQMLIENSELNTSDHLALIVEIQMENNGKKQNEGGDLGKKGQTNININWQSQKSVEKYEEILNKKLKNIKFNNIMRDQVEAKEKIDKYYVDLKNAFVSAHDEVIDVMYKNKSNKNQWWTKEMTTLKKELKEARRKYKMWKDEESLIAVKNAKRKFRREQRRCIFVFEECKNRNIEVLFDKPSKEEFWKSLDQFKDGKKERHLNDKDTKILKENITSLLTHKNEKIENDVEKMKIVETVNKYEKQIRLTVSAQEKQYTNRETIKNIIKELKNNRTKGYDGMNNNMVKTINSELIQNKITNLINAILNTGYTPEFLNRSIIIPIIKDKTKTEFDKNNFRPISISNVFAQILEKVILLKCKELENTSNFQFGFKNQMSTLHPLFLLKEIINTHLEENMPLYIASLDSEKAYDSIWRDGLFFKLMNAIDPQFWLILRDYYSKSDGVFKINGVTDNDIVKITRGVKQGGVISPKLFNFFINELIETIEKSGYGGRILEQNIPIMGFCDDTLLIEKLLQNLRKLIETCEIYSNKWLLKYNAKKSCIINCGRHIYEDDEIDIMMNGEKLAVVSVCKYLGMEINNENDDNKQMMKNVGKIQKCFYGLSSFGIKPPGLQPEIKAFLYNTYCKPMGTYGMGLLKLKPKTLQQINISQNNLMRYSLGIPYKTHIKNLMKAIGIIDSETTYLMEKCTVIKLLHRTDISKNVLIRNIEQKNTNWWFYKEIESICERLRIEPEELCLYPDKTRRRLQIEYFEGNEVEKEIIQEIKDLLKNYNFVNKKKLIELIKLEWM
jgi:hypothetical protein